MSAQRTRKRGKTPHYGFLVSWQEKPSSEARVKGETINAPNVVSASFRHRKNAESLAQAGLGLNVKKDIFKSLLTISLVLILELVVYLAWIKFVK